MRLQLLCLYPLLLTALPQAKITPAKEKAKDQQLSDSSIHIICGEKPRIQRNRPAKIKALLLTPCTPTSTQEEQDAFSDLIVRYTNSITLTIYSNRSGKSRKNTGYLLAENFEDYNSLQTIIHDRDITYFRSENKTQLTPFDGNKANELFVFLLETKGDYTSASSTVRNIEKHGYTVEALAATPKTLDRAVTRGRVVHFMTNEPDPKRWHQVLRASSAFYQFMWPVFSFIAWWHRKFSR